MPIPLVPEEDRRPHQVARLVEAARAFDPTRLRRIIRRAWSRVLMSICLAEARCHPASFRVRPPPALPPGHQITAAGAGPDEGAADPFAHLAHGLGLPRRSTGAIARRRNSHPPASPDGHTTRADSALGGVAARPGTGLPQTRGPDVHPSPRRPPRLQQQDRPGRRRPRRPPARPVGDPGPRSPGAPDRPTRPARPTPVWSGAEERACDLGDALILAAALAGAGLGGTLLGGFGACLGLWIGLMLGGSYVERPRDDRW